MELLPIYFEGGYLICGTLCILISLLYTIFIWSDFKSLTPKLPCYKSSQVLFIIGCLIRGLGYISQAAITYLYSDDYNIIYMCDTITVGLPGYIITIAYLFLFYLWASICVNIISNDSTTGIRERTKTVFNCLLTFILTLGVVLIGIVILAFLQKYDFVDLAHEIEVLTAFSRDFITATIILVQSITIFKMSKKPLFPINSSKESTYFWMLLGLIIPLYIRSVSLIFLLYAILNKIEGRMLSSFLNTFITAIISELFPCFMILINWKRSGFLSVYDTIG